VQLVEALRYKLEGPGFEPIPVAEQSKAKVRSQSLAKIAGSNPVGGMD
jgi:hypothetical protein